MSFISGILVFLLVAPPLSPKLLHDTFSELAGGKFSSLMTIFVVAVVVAAILSPAYQYAKWRSAIYATTDRRAIIKLRLPWPSVQSFYRAHIETIEKRLRRDGTGSLIFRTEIRSAGEGTYKERYGFYHLADVNTADQWLQRIVADGK